MTQKIYSEEERLEIAVAISALSELTAETDAHLAKNLGTHRSNVSAFTSLRRPESVSNAGISRLLEHYGLIYSGKRGFLTDEGPCCPVFELVHLSDADAHAISRFMSVLARHGLSSAVHPLCNRDGDFIFVIETTTEDAHPDYWCAAALGMKGSNEVLELLVQHGAVSNAPVSISDELYELWTRTAPRRSEAIELLETSFNEAEGFQPEV